MDRWRRDVASRVTIRNILIREGLAECLGTFILVVSSKVATISCVELTGTFVYETQCKDLPSCRAYVAAWKCGYNVYYDFT